MWSKAHKPLSRAEFDRRFPDEASCAEHLAALRWPEGLACPHCAGRKGRRLEGDRGLWECAGCHRQTSVTAGTAMHQSKVPLRAWFTALHIVTSHSNGMSALQLQSQLGLGSWNTAWLLLRKIRAAMAAPEGDGALFRGLVEVDETSIPCRSKEDDLTADSRGRSHLGKIALIGAVEIDEGGRPGRARLAVLAGYSADKIGAFVRKAVAPKSGLLTDGLPAYKALAGEYNHRPKVVGKMAAHVVMPWAHRLFSRLLRWGTGTFHGFRRPHLQAHLDEFAWRWSRRNFRHTSFDRLLDGLAARPHRAYRDFVPGRAAGTA